jgi:hypothetical protein
MWFAVHAAASDMQEQREAFAVQPHAIESRDPKPRPLDCD